MRHAARSSILEDGGAIDQETRLFDPNKGETRSMRSKEEAHDYRYFPDPDLLPLEFSEDYIAGLKAGLPELPDQKKARFIADLGLSPYDAGVLVAERESADFFESRAVRSRRQGPGRQTRRQLGDQRTVRAPQQGRPGHRSIAGLGRAAWSDRRSDWRGHDLRQDREGSVRDRLAAKAAILARWWRRAG